MNKSELIEKVAEGTGLSKVDVDSSFSLSRFKSTEAN